MFMGAELWAFDLGDSYENVVILVSLVVKMMLGRDVQEIIKS